MKGVLVTFFFCFSQEELMKGNMVLCWLYLAAAKWDKMAVILWN